MIVESFVFDTPLVNSHACQLKMAAKRYTDPTSQARGGFTIIACHGLGQRQYCLLLLLLLTATQCQFYRQGTMGAHSGEAVQPASAENRQTTGPRGLGV